MAAVNAELFKRLMDKLGIGRAALYRRIQQSNDLVLEANLAALAFAQANNISITRYSSKEEREELRQSRTGQTSQRSVSAAAPAVASRSSQRSRPAQAVRKPRDGSVFVVHGRNETLRKSMFEFLRSIGLDPIEWEKAVAKAKGGNPYVGEVLRTAMERAQAIVVLFTPDEEARLKPEFCARGEKRTEGALASQARPNVIFEAGWAVGAFPKKTVLVQVGKNRSFSDIGGRLMVHLTDDVAKRKSFASRLKSVGCKPDLDGDDWIKAGKFKQ